MMFKVNMMTLLCLLHVLPVFSQSQPKEDDLGDESYGVLISGGFGFDDNIDIHQSTAELYLPSSNISCSLPQMPDGRIYHTIESSGLLCGGIDTENTCLQWIPDTGSWELLTLAAGRWDHVSWTPGTDNGTYLIGGNDWEGMVNGMTTTLMKPDGTQEPGFPLLDKINEACAIPTDDTVILTGGRKTHNLVSVYNVEGWQRDLPPLNTGRWNHACSSYWADERRILIVMGGWGTDRRHFILDVIETFDINLGRWATSGSTLPRLMTGLRAANIDGRVLIFGGSNGGYHYYDDILEYNPEDESILHNGNMLQGRGFHAVSVVQAQDYVQWCQ